MAKPVVNTKAEMTLTTKTHLGNLLFLLPTILLFTFVVLIPFFQGIPYSFTSWKSVVSTNHPFNGIANYKYLLGNKYFKMSLGVTFSFTIQYMFWSILFGFGLALLIHRESKFNNFARTIFFLPFTTSVTAGAIIWSYLWTDVYGTLTGLVSPLGIPDQIVPAMAIMASWRDMGYAMLIFIAALQTVSKDYYEAATVEGANKVQQFFYITIPNIVPAFTTNTTLLLAWGLKVFEVVRATTKGGPTLNETTTMSMFVFDNIFANWKAGYGQAAAIVMTLILLVISFIVSKFFRKQEVY